MMESVLRHRAATAIVASMLALGTAACGTGSPQEPDSLDDETTKSDNQSGDNQSGDNESGAQPDTSGMPTITLGRSGGFAGYQDELIITPDGTAKLTSGSSGEAFTCKVEPTILTGLAKNATDAPKPKLISKKGAPSPIPDQINITLEVDGQQVRREMLAEKDTRWEALFSATGRVLSSATALRDGTKQPNELACTRK